MNQITGWLERRARLIDWATRLVGTAGLVAAIALYADQRSYVNCQADFNEATNLRSRIIAEAGDQERDRVRAVIQSAARMATDPAAAKPPAERTDADRARLAELYRAYRTALSEYEKATASADAARADNPVPPPPSVVCG